MKYTILGFSQQQLLNINLGTDEAMILRWFVDFQSTGRMKKVIHEGKTWSWVNYSGVLEDLPIVGGSTKTISRRFEKLVNAGVLEHVTIKEGGVFSCFRICEEIYIKLVDTSSEVEIKPETIPLDKFVQLKTELSDPRTDLSEQKTLLLDTKNIPPDRTSSIFPQGDKSTLRKRFLKPTLSEVKAYCHERGELVNPERWYDHYEANGWKVGKAPMKDWKAAVRTWERNSFGKPEKEKSDFRNGRVNTAWEGEKTGRIDLGS